ncbi:hypothetical protein C8R46DRAFT_1268564 [Mycena filopes]|nr:hypothetical protein C8R46DRAFT_1268564 [Mycena filopes]
MKTEKVAYDTKLPPEVWIRCSLGCRHEDLCSLALVSRYFHDLFMPLIHEHQYIVLPDPEHSDWTLTLKAIQRYIPSVARVGSNTDISFRVKQWAFWGTLSIPFAAPPSENHEITSLEESHTQLLLTFIDTLGKCPNLRSLHLTCVAIDQAMQKSILTLFRLEELMLASCDLSRWTAAALPIQKLELVDKNTRLAMPGVEGDPLHIVSPSSLRALTLEGLGISVSLLSGFATTGSQPFDNLTFVSVQLWDPFLSPFFTFLARCPQLTQLEIPKAAVTATPDVPLPPTTIPLLCCFKGPRFLAAFFVLGRPVCEVELLDGGGCRPKAAETEKDVLEDLKDIARACPAVHTVSMTLPVVDCARTTAAIAKHWPGLRVLSLVLRTSSGVRHPFSTEPLDFSDSDAEEDGEDESDAEGEEENSASGDSHSSESHSNHQSNQFSAFDPAAFEDPRLAGVPPPVPTPDVLTPGYLYTQDGASPPPRAPVAPVNPRGPTQTLLSALDNFEFPHLESLHFPRPSMSVPPINPLSLPHQHRAVLALERRLPRLRLLEFGARYLDHVCFSLTLYHTTTLAPAFDHK